MNMIKIEKEYKFIITGEEAEILINLGRMDITLPEFFDKTKKDTYGLTKKNIEDFLRKINTK